MGNSESFNDTLMSGIKLTTIGSSSTAVIPNGNATAIKEEPTLPRHDLPEVKTETIDLMAG